MTAKIKETLEKTESVTLWEGMVCIIQISGSRRERIMKLADTEE